MDNTVTSWATLSSNLIGDCFDVAKPCLDKNFSEIDPMVRFVAAQLFIDCQLSSESVLLLIRQQKEWDADLIARAVMEGSIKFVFMLEGTADEVKAKVVRYWDILPLLSGIRRSERAKQLLDAIPNSHDPEWQPLRDLIVDEAEISATRQQYTRQDRQRLEQRWSFSGICGEFAASKNRALQALAHLAWGYGLSSHLIHKDADGIGMVWDRFRRDSERQNAVKLGHSARIVLDVCTFAELRLRSLFRLCDKPTTELSRIAKRYDHLFCELKAASEHFNRIEYGDGTSQSGEAS